MTERRRIELEGDLKTLFDGRRRMELEGGLKTLFDHNKIHVKDLDVVVDTRWINRKLEEYRCTIVFDLVSIGGVPTEALVRYHHEIVGIEDQLFIIEPNELEKEKRIIGEKIKIFERILQV